MGEKKSLTISLSTFFLLLAIIVICVMGYFVYKLYNERTIATEEISNLNNQIGGLENTVNVLQESIDNVSNNSQSNNNEISDNKYTEITDELEGIDVLYVTNAINNNDDTYTLKGVLYTQYTLSEAELQQIIDKGYMEINGERYVIKNNDSNEYDLYQSNVDYPLYKIKPINSNSYYLEAQAQISDVWKLTDEYKEITVSGNTKCSMFSDYEEEYNTVEDVFNDFDETEPIETTNPNSEKTFTFKFENGECVEIIGAFTAV